MNQALFTTFSLIFDQVLRPAYQLAIGEWMDTHQGREWIADHDKHEQAQKASQNYRKSSNRPSRPNRGGGKERGNSFWGFVVFVFIMYLLAQMGKN